MAIQSLGIPIANRLFWSSYSTNPSGRPSLDAGPEGKESVGDVVALIFFSGEDAGAGVRFPCAFKVTMKTMARNAMTTDFRKPLMMNSS
jgi:hypothetical protein